MIGRQYGDWIAIIVLGFVAVVLAFTFRGVGPLALNWPQAWVIVAALSVLVGVIDGQLWKGREVLPFLILLGGAFALAALVYVEGLFGWPQEYAVVGIGGFLIGLACGRML